MVAECCVECLPWDRLLFINSFGKEIPEAQRQTTACAPKALIPEATNSTAHGGTIYSSYANTKMGQTDTWSMWADKFCCGKHTRAKLRILMISGSHVPSPLHCRVVF